MMQMGLVAFLVKQGRDLHDGLPTIHVDDCLKIFPPLEIHGRIICVFIADYSILITGQVSK